MQYHIQTTPIWDSFKQTCECPMCKLYSHMSERLIKQYLGEAVMEPVYRIKVNKKGFCAKHMAELYKGGNKLGTALQIHTRTSHIIGNLLYIDNPKKAKKESEKIISSLSSCVICESVDDMMEQYAITIAQMFANEKDFPPLLDNIAPFCLPHYAMLLKYASFAGKSAQKFLSEISSKQIIKMKMVNDELEKFTKRFDYASTGLPLKNKDPLKSSVNMLKGPIV